MVNAVIRRLRQAHSDSLELARDLKKSKKQRQAVTDAMRKNEKERAAAAKQDYRRPASRRPNPRYSQVLARRRMPLAVPLHGQVHFHGGSVWPRAAIRHRAHHPLQPLDGQLLSNLTLCYHEENRNVKRGRTPFQAYHWTERYDQVLDRVARFTGERRMVAAKLTRFKMNDEELEIFLEDFRNRQLNDTAYAAQLAKKYLGLLYGGEVDEQNRRRVFARSGRATSDFRALWKLNAILNDGPTTDGGRTEKKRADHRHHRVDAVVIGLASDSMIQRLSNAAQVAPQLRRRLFGPLEGPWPNFVDTVRAEINRITPSHRVSKKVSGALHEETIYSRFDPEAPKGSLYREPRLRKWINELSAKDVHNIADENVRSRVREKLDEVGGDPGKLPDPKDPANLQKLPYMIAKEDGRHIPIKRVRVKVSVQPVAIGTGAAQRYVKLGSNHHIEIYAEPDRRGREHWKGETVTMLAAYSRVKNGAPVVNPERRGNLMFSLGPRELVRFDDGPFKGQLFAVRGMTQEGGGRVFLVPVNDARSKEEIVESKLYRRDFVNTLRQWKTRKIRIDPLGMVSEAHD